MKKLLLGCLALLCVTGCSSSKTTVCKLEETGISIETTFEHDGTTIQKQTSVNKIDLSILGLTDEEFTNLADSYEELFNIIDGVEYKVEVNDHIATETTTIDYSKTDITSLQNAGIVESGEIDYVGIKETIETSEEAGFTCTTK